MYYICCADSVEDLEELVNSVLEQDGLLVGGPFVWNNQICQGASVDEEFFPEFDEIDEKDNVITKEDMHSC